MLPPTNDNPSPAPRRMVPLIGTLHVDEDRFEPHQLVRLLAPAGLAALFPSDPREP